jgi:hypothetical protein
MKIRKLKRFRQFEQYSNMSVKREVLKAISYLSSKQRYGDFTFNCHYINTQQPFNFKRKEISVDFIVMENEMTEYNSDLNYCYIPTFNPSAIFTDDTIKYLSSKVPQHMKNEINIFDLI